MLRHRVPIYYLRNHSQGNVGLGGAFIIGGGGGGLSFSEGACPGSSDW